jgi:hypothetical protein
LVFITINLFNFILFFLNNFFWTNLEKNTITDEMNPSAFDNSCHYYRRLYKRMYSVGILNTHRQIYRWYIAVGKSWYHRQNKNPSVYFKRETFFWCANSVCKTIDKWFFCFSDWYSDGTGNHQRRESRRT